MNASKESFLNGALKWPVMDELLTSLIPFNCFFDFRLLPENTQPGFDKMQVATCKYKCKHVLAKIFSKIKDFYYFAFNLDYTFTVGLPNHPADCKSATAKQ